MDHEQDKEKREEERARKHEKALLKDEVEAASSSWPNGKEARHGAMV
jgi:hypothetical protein